MKKFSGTQRPAEVTLPADAYSSITTIGFGTPHPSHPHSPALQRQVALLESDKHADYFLFDDTDRPIRVVFADRNIRTCFRLIRSEAMFGPEPSRNILAMGEQLTKTMADRPGLSKVRIMAQFEREYGKRTADYVAAHLAKGGHESGRTFVETMSMSIAERLPTMIRLTP